MGAKVNIALASLIVGAAGGGSYGMMLVDETKLKLIEVMKEKDQAALNANRMRAMIDDAAKKYGKELGALVMAAGAPASAAPPAAAPAQGQPAAPAAAPAADDPAKLVDDARAILAARDGYRVSLDGVRAALSSEFDALAAELGSAKPNAAKVKQILDGLKQNWPNKEKDIEAATRKLLVDLNVQQALRAPKPAAAPAPEPAPAPAPAPAATKPAPAPAAKK
jgi:hypothetical protein